MKKGLGFLTAAGAAAGTAGVIFTIWCNQQLKNDRQTFRPDHMEQIPEADFILVPGCLVHRDGTPSNALKDRLDAAAALYREGKADRIILSGIRRENEAGKIYLKEQGIPAENIRSDHGGLDTYSTIYRCREAFPGKRFLICTQEKYFKRTGFLISELGMDGFCVRSDARKYRRERYERFRDFFAADKAWLECRIIRPKPKYPLQDLPISY